MALTDQPAVQVRAVRGVANPERPHVAVPALNRAGDRVRPDPRPERLSGVVPALVAVADRLRGANPHESCREDGEDFLFLCGPVYLRVDRIGFRSYSSPTLTAG